MDNNEIIKIYKQRIDKKRTEIISALTAMSLFITSTSYIISKDRLDSKERYYKTEKYTYNDYYRTINHHYEYNKASDPLHYVVIRKVTPWIIDGVEARRKITIYKIKNIDFDTLIYKGNYKKVIDNLDFEVTNEYKYKNELRDYDRYEDSYYEVIDATQNKDEYIEKTRFVSIDTILMLLSEIVIYLFILKINEGPLYETIITDIKDINEYKDKIKKLKK